MDTHRDDLDLSAELHALRPTPHAPFTDELDARVAARFVETSKRSGDLRGRFTQALRNSSPQRFLLPAGAAALSALVIATAVIAIGQTGEKSSQPRQLAGAGDGAGERVGKAAKAAGEGSRAHLGTGRPQSGFQYSDAPPTAESAASSAGQPSSGAASDAEFRSSAAPASPIARHRNVERDAELILQTQPGEVDEASRHVFSAVHAANGVVLSSSTQSQEANASARFELLVPSAKLSDALASLSQIADVSSRHESTLDITTPTVGVGERLQDSRARIDGLLAQLADAESDDERIEVEAALRGERRNAAALRSRLDRLQRRADFARVSLRIESDNDAGAASPGSWDVGDALGDAGRILTIAAGVVVIGLAVVGPLALILLLAWLGHRAWVRQRRERALS